MATIITVMFYSKTLFRLLIAYYIVVAILAVLAFSTEGLLWAYYFYFAALPTIVAFKAGAHSTLTEAQNEAICVLAAVLNGCLFYCIGIGVKLVVTKVTRVIKGGQAGGSPQISKKP